jgi:coenzyme F420-reducing hydrogenase delta subunit
VEYTKKLLDEIGIGGERLEFFHIAASEAPLFAEIVRQMTDRARALGPNPYKIGSVQDRKEKGDTDDYGRQKAF